MRTATDTRTLYALGELSPEAQDRAIEALWDCNVDYSGWWEDEGILHLPEKDYKRIRAKLDSEFMPLVFDEFFFELDRGAYITFKDLSVSNEDAFRRFLQIPKALWENLDYRFTYPRESENEIEFNVSSYGRKIDFTARENKILDHAADKFSDLMHHALRSLQSNYEYLTSREAIVETIEANEWEFAEDGTPSWKLRFEGVELL